MANQIYAFWRGLAEIPPTKRPEIEARIRTELGLKNDAYRARRRGKVEPTLSESKLIEAVFAEFKVPASRVWGPKPTINPTDV